MTFKSSIPSPAPFLKRRQQEGDYPGPDRRSRNRHYLHAGQVFSSQEATQVTTILGSCVAVCLYEPDLEIGGINHFLLPDWAGRGRASPRFGNVAIASLIEQMVSQGGVLKNLEAKLFGGARLLDSDDSDAESLGAKNVEVARELLADEEISVVAEDVGGLTGRKLIYHTDSGAVWVKRL